MEDVTKDPSPLAVKETHKKDERAPAPKPEPKDYGRKQRGNEYTENRQKEPDLFIQERVQQRLSLLEQNPNSLVYSFNHPQIKERLLQLVRLLDAADATIREEWGYGITMEEILEWDKVLNQVKNMAEKITSTALRLGEDILMFDFSEIKHQRMRDKIAFVETSDVPVEILINNSNIALPLFEMIITIDKYDSVIRRHFNTKMVKEQWIDQINGFIDLLKKSNKTAYALIYKAKGGVIKSIRFVNLKKEIHSYREAVQREEAIKNNDSRKKPKPNE